MIVESQYWLYRRFKKRSKISPIQAVKTEFHLDDDGQSRKETSFGEALGKILEEEDLKKEEQTR